MGNKDIQKIASPEDKIELDKLRARCSVLHQKIHDLLMEVSEYIDVIQKTSMMKEERHLSE